MSHSAIQEVVAVLGQPVAGNPTQYVLEKSFAHAGLDWRCLTLEVTAAGLADAIRGARVMGFRGLQLAEPHLSTAIGYLDRVGPTAAATATVNCIWREEGAFVGENTLGKGCMRALTQAIDPIGKQIAIFGAGTTARAIAGELGLAGAARLFVVSHDLEPARELAVLLEREIHAPAQAVSWEGDFQIPPEVEILIQATSIGAVDAEARVPLDLSTLEADMVVADVTHIPPETRLIREARNRGCPTIDGLAILANQLATSFKIWTGHEAEPEVMRDALEEFFAL